MVTQKPFKIIKELYINARRMLSFGYEMDKKLTLLYYLTATIGAVIPVAGSYFYKFLIDYLQKTQGVSFDSIPLTLILILGGVYIISILEDVVFYGLNYSYYDYLFRYKLQNKISLQFYKKVSSLDIQYFEDSDKQNLITTTRDTMLWRVPDFLRNFRDFTVNIVAYLAAVLALLPFGIWIPALITFIAIPRIYLRAKHGALQWSIYGSGAPQAKKLWYFGHLMQEQKSVKEMKIAQSSSGILKKYEKIQNHLYNLNKGPLDKYLKVRNIPGLIEICILFVIAIYYLPPTLAGTLTIGSFTLIITLMGRINSNAAGSAQRIGELYENSLYVNNYMEVLNLPKIIREDKNPVVFSKIKSPEITFDKVSFNYPDGPTVLDNISFTVKPGESVAFVGENGAGKSTIVKLLCRFYDVTEGNILINGINIKNVKLSNWYKFLGTLFQEFTQYHFSVRDNITLGAPDKNDEKLVYEAAKKSGADKFIESLPDKYNQILGREFEEGIELSGGQWQKLAIARAFYEEPPVLILDEPTSAIDAEAEFEIFNNLQKEYKEKTLILVSHRFSTVRNASKIYVVENGKIIEQGSHEKLMELGEKYFKMFSIQAKGYK
jgi:ATP-binding cassette, subfamily B, bacterial